MKKYILLFALFCITINIAQAQVPNWSVTPSNYTYSMNITAQLNLACVTLQAPADLVGAFVNGDCRGVEYTSNFVSGNNLAFLTIFSNAIVGDTVRFKVYDASADTIIDAITYVIFQDGNALGTPTAPYVIFTREQPTDLGLDNTLVAEDSVGAFVGLVSSLDTSGLNSYVYGLVAGVGDSENGNFQVSNDSLFTSVALDFETLSSQSIRMIASDGGCIVEKVFTIILTDVNEKPIDIALSNNTIDENLQSGTLVGNFNSTDVDAGDSHTYMMVAGTGDVDNNQFIIVNNELRSSQILDFEAEDTLRIRVQSEDTGGLTYDESFEILLNNTNDLPTDIVLSTDSFPENLPLNTSIIGLSTVDQDTADTFSYSFDNSQTSDNSLFLLDGDTIRTFASFDFETQNIYVIRITSTDNAGSNVTKQFILNVQDANDSPTDLFISNQSIPENVPLNSFVGLFSTIDIDAIDSFAYTFSPGGLDNASFTISNDSLFTDTTFDFFVKTEYEIKIQTTDLGSLSFIKDFTIYISNSNDPPTDLGLSDSTIVENSIVGTIVGTLSSIDPDIGQGHTYSLVSGTGDVDNSSFGISGGDLVSNAVFDFEVQDTFYIRLRTTDFSGLWFEKELIILISDANDFPTEIQLTSYSMYENETTSSVIGNFITTDQDTMDTHAYTFVPTPGSDNASFIIVGNQLLNNDVFNFEVKSIYYTYVSTDDGNGGTYNTQLIIQILDTNEAPTAQSLSNNLNDENSAVNTFIGIFSTTDEDTTDTHTYSLTAGTGDDDNAMFTVFNDSLFCIQVLNYEIANTRSILVNTTDNGGNSLDQIYTIDVVDKNDTPSAVLIGNSLIDENNVLLANVGSFSTTDEDAIDTHTYSFVSGTGDDNNGNFLISGADLLLNTIADFEGKSSYTILIQTLDSGNETFTQQFTITIGDVNEAPVINDAIFQISEDAVLNTIIGTVTFTDEDANDAHSFYFINASEFEMIDTEIELVSELNYEDDVEFTLQLVIEDIDGLTDMAIISIQVLDEIEEGSMLPVNLLLSPDGDGHNDYFFIQNVQLYEDYSLMVFNNAGNVVYSVDRSYDNSWEAKYKGNVLSEGVYYYFFQSNADKDNFFKGTISIIH